jgi:hypothetical protein
MMRSVADRSGVDLLGEWRKAMGSLVASLSNRTELPRQLLEPMQRQLELVQEIVERERALQREVASRLLAPVDAVFDLLAESGVMLRRQAEALESAAHALEDTAGLVKAQADLFERTISLMREPAELAKVAAGLERGSTRKSATSRRKPATSARKPATSRRKRTS